LVAGGQPHRRNVRQVRKYHGFTSPQLFPGRIGKRKAGFPLLAFLEKSSEFVFGPIDLVFIGAV
jgi:hypothetical protein